MSPTSFVSSLISLFIWKHIPSDHPDLFFRIGKFDIVSKLFHHLQKGLIHNLLRILDKPVYIRRRGSHLFRKSAWVVYPSTHFTFTAISILFFSILLPPIVLFNSISLTVTFIVPHFLAFVHPFSLKKQSDLTDCKYEMSVWRNLCK